MKIVIDTQNSTQEEIRKVVDMLDMANDVIRAIREAFALHGYDMPCLDDMVHKMASDGGFRRKYPSEPPATS
jgi:hypothetical protein